MIALLLALSLFADEPPQVTSPRDNREVTGAIITRPEGAFLRGDYQHRVGGSPVRIGAFDSFLVYSNEAGVELGVVTRPEWLEVHLEGALEPGFYIHTPKSGIPPGQSPPSKRTADLREVARAQANLNLRGDRWWIYGRSTAEARFRNFHEYDEFRGIEVARQEYSFEQAIAPIFRIGPLDGPGYWAYGEYTVGAVRDVGTLPHRFSAGVITEDWLTKGLSLDLDVFYSIARDPGPGPGVILAWWYAW